MKRPKPTSAQVAKLAGVSKWTVIRAFDPDASIHDGTRERVRAAAESPQVAKHIADTRALAKALNLEGTPAFIVGDRLIPGADMAALNAAIVELKARDAKPMG